VKDKAENCFGKSNDDGQLFGGGSNWKIVQVPQSKKRDFVQK
jgi:hypothetical protein